MDQKLELVEGSPLRRVLVQWQGLLPDDTSWENWDELCATYDLEDKVVFDEGGIDMDKATSSKGKSPIIEPRPKR
ncbi:hypothetical protein A2U01_0102297, partial [Trifolium medium]|nr:hypothetical protein [Trifolium medium]